MRKGVKQKGGQPYLIRTNEDIGQMFRSWLYDKNSVIDKSGHIKD